MGCRGFFRGARRAFAALCVAGVAHGPLVGADEPTEQVRPADCAGMWYPGEADALSKFVDDLIERAAPNELPSGRPQAIIAPHAGYQYSAPVASMAYKAVKGLSYKRVILLGFSHRYSAFQHGIDVPMEYTAYQTPLGKVPLDAEACAALLKCPLFTSTPGLHRQEHSLELQLPFLQRTIGEFRLVPLMVGELSSEECTQVASALLPWVGDDTLIVVSSDFTHYGRSFNYVPFTENVAEQLRIQAREAAKPLLNADYDGFVDYLARTTDTICGRRPSLLLMRVLAMQGGASAVRTGFDTSGRMTGDYAGSVTYQSFVFAARELTLPADARGALLKLARRTAIAHLNKERLEKISPADLPEAARADGACFVTLENRGVLRGCIGNMEATGPLYEAVIRNAIYACQDQRFVDNPVTPAELKDIRIEISYLTPMLLISNPDEVVVGRDGLLVELGPRRGVLLPQVAYSHGWTRREFLAQVCHKAGLPADAWKDPRAHIYSFAAEVFGEP